jgi:hypothetical protein
MPAAENATISANIALKLLMSASRIGSGRVRPILSKRTVPLTPTNTSEPNASPQIIVKRNNCGSGRDSKKSKKIMAQSKANGDES